MKGVPESYGHMTRQPGAAKNGATSEERVGVEIGLAAAWEPIAVMVAGRSMMVVPTATPDGGGGLAPTFR